jgi:hypothetical protein
MTQHLVASFFFFVFFFFFFFFFVFFRQIMPRSSMSSYVELTTQYGGMGYYCGNQQGGGVVGCNSSIVGL